MRAARQGRVPETVSVKAPNWDAVTPQASVETVVEATTTHTDGVVVECVQEGGRLRIRVASPGYRPTWRVRRWGGR